MSKQVKVILAFVLFVFIRCFFIEPNTLEVTKYNIKCPELKGLRIAFLSDFHLKKREYKKLDKIIQLTNKQEPDIVLLGGDFAVGHNAKKMMNPDVMAQKLTLLNAPIFSVLGEHDVWSNEEGITNAFKNNSITLLKNTNKKITVDKKKLYIVGLDDLTTGELDIEKAIRNTKNPRIILTHNPDVYYDIMDEATLILAGHTHGGQFVLPLTPPFVGSKFGSEFANGLIDDPRTKNEMIITKGLGMSGLPLRLNCKPEIVVVDFTD